MTIHGMVYLPVQYLTDDCPATVRAGNFGRFAAVYDEDLVIKPEVLPAIIRTLTLFKYIYIPFEILNLPYTGKNPGVDGIQTWGHRYFNFL